MPTQEHERERDQILVHTLSPEGELLPPHHGEHRDDENGHQREIAPSGRVPERVLIGFRWLRRLLAAELLIYCAPRSF